MSKFLEIANGQDGQIVWLENNEGHIYGICHDQTVIDVDGMPSTKQEMGADVFLALEEVGFELEQDWDNETTSIQLRSSAGDNCKLVFSGSSIEIVND